jgi:hypothetical protein
LSIFWDINKVEVRDVYLLFSGLDLFLNETARAVLKSDEFAGLIDAATLEGGLLHIEVMELQLASITTVWKVALQWSNAALKHPVLGGVVSSVIAHVLITLSPTTSQQSKPAPLSAELQNHIQEGGKRFAQSLGASGRESKLNIRNMNTKDQITVRLGKRRPRVG